MGSSCLGCPHIPWTIQLTAKGQNVPEIINVRGGDPVSLRPCPSWCALSQHFADGDTVDADDSFHHYGPEIAIPTSDRAVIHGPATVVKVTLKSWTHPLSAGPGPGRVELQLATTECNTDMSVELTPGQARAVASALIELAGIAERPGQQ